MKRVIGLSVLSLLLLSSCATRTPQQLNAILAQAERQIICTNKDDAEVKFGRAILWITRNSHWKIRNQSESLISTEIGRDIFSGYTVQKLPIGGGKYQIMVDVTCPSMAGCYPDTFESKAALVNFILNGN